MQPNAFGLDNQHALWDVLKSVKQSVWLTSTWANALPPPVYAYARAQHTRTASLLLSHTQSPFNSLFHCRTAKVSAFNHVGWLRRTGKKQSARLVE